MKLLVTRPEPDASHQGAELGALGHRAIVEPMLDIVFGEDQTLDLEGVQALIATSRNGLRALERMASIEAACKLPLFAVGPASAEKARALEFSKIHQGPGDGRGLAALVRETVDPKAGALLHLAGAYLAGDLKGRLEAAGYEMRQPVLYKAQAREKLSDRARQALGAGDIEGVILMSPRTATIYARLVAESGVAEAAGQAVHFCLSATVAEKLAGPLGRNVQISDGPHTDDLLALIAREAAD